MLQSARRTSERSKGRALTSRTKRCHKENNTKRIRSRKKRARKKNEMGGGDGLQTPVRSLARDNSPSVGLPLILALAARSLARPPRPIPVPSLVVFVQGELVVLLPTLNAPSFFLFCSVDAAELQLKLQMRIELRASRATSGGGRRRNRNSDYFENIFLVSKSWSFGYNA